MTEDVVEQSGGVITDQITLHESDYANGQQPQKVVKLMNIQILDPKTYQFVAQMEVDGAEIPTTTDDGFDIIFDNITNPSEPTFDLIFEIDSSESGWTFANDPFEAKTGSTDDYIDWNHDIGSGQTQATMVIAEPPKTNKDMSLKYKIALVKDGLTYTCDPASSNRRRP